MHDDPAHVDFAAHRSHSIAGQGGEPGQGAQQGGADEYGVRSSTLIGAWRSPAPRHVCLASP